MTEPGIRARVAAEIAPLLPPGWTAIVNADGHVALFHEGEWDGTFGGTWDAILTSIEDAISRVTTEPFEIPRRDT